MSTLICTNVLKLWKTSPRFPTFQCILRIFLPVLAGFRWKFVIARKLCFVMAKNRLASKPTCFLIFIKWWSNTLNMKRFQIIFIVQKDSQIQIILKCLGFNNLWVLCTMFKYIEDHWGQSCVSFTFFVIKKTQPIYINSSSLILLMKIVQKCTELKRNFQICHLRNTKPIQGTLSIPWPIVCKLIGFKFSFFNLKIQCL